MRYFSARIVTRLAVFAALAGAVLLPAVAKAWVVFGLPPVVIAPPVAPYAPYYPPAYPYPPGYYYPPYGYAPPPAAAPAPPAAQPEMSRADTPYGSTCYAGVYTCAAPYGLHVGTTCACPGLGAPSYGTVH